MIKIAFYDTKAYDKPSFEHYGAEHDMDIEKCKKERKQRCF